MALTCNSFASNTVGTTQQIAACKVPHLANLEDHQLLPEQFLLLVIDVLTRLNELLGPALPAGVGDVVQCDAAEALRLASCAMLTNTPAFPLTTPQLQSIILWQLNQFICSET